MRYAKVEKIIAALGGTTSAAELCGVTPGAVSQWISNEYIPKNKLMFLELKRPDVFHGLRVNTFSKKRR